MIFGMVKNMTGGNKYILSLDNDFKYNIDDWIEIDTTKKKSRTFIYEDDLEDDMEKENFQDLRG